MEDRIREFDGVTYKDLFLSSIDVVYIRRLDIVQKPAVMPVCIWRLFWMESRRKTSYRISQRP